MWERVCCLLLRQHTNQENALRTRTPWPYRVGKSCGLCALCVEERWGGGRGVSTRPPAVEPRCTIPQTASDVCAGWPRSLLLRILQFPVPLQQLAYSTISTMLSTLRPHRAQLSTRGIVAASPTSAPIRRGTWLTSATAAKDAVQQQPEQPQRNNNSSSSSVVNISKRHLLAFGCACCLSLQAQQHLPAAADSGYYSYEGAQRTGVPVRRLSFLAAHTPASACHGQARRAHHAGRAPAAAAHSSRPST